MCIYPPLLTKDKRQKTVIANFDWNISHSLWVRIAFFQQSQIQTSVKGTDEITYRYLTWNENHTNYVF